MSKSQTTTDRIQTLLSAHRDVRTNIPRSDLIAQSVEQKLAIISQSGALATWTPSDSTGRIPKDTYMVEHGESKETIDWSSPVCIPMKPGLFDRLLEDALNVLNGKDAIYVLDRSVGADSKYALPTKLVTDSPLHALFADNMFRAVPHDMGHSIFADNAFTLVAVPYDRVDISKYDGELRAIEDATSDQVVAMDFDRRLGLVYGLPYCGGVKKTMFTVMNYLLPEHRVLPLHCSANEAADGSVALFLGLSGTGKTTLSNVEDRKMIGDDEHGWSDAGIANFENGSYAKLIHLREDKEPQIYHAIFDERPFTDHGAIIENAMVYPDGSVDLDDDRYTENSRGSYPLSFLSNVKEDAKGGHPSTILFLTADAEGVLPPVAKLSPCRAMLWFLMGYTSKLAGTETGVTEPKAAFSRFFGAPFMPRCPKDYADLLGRKMEEHGASVYLVNTGWSGGPFGVGRRMDISVTRTLVAAALEGTLADVECRTDKRFHLEVPTSCPGVESAMLDPRNTWEDKRAYDRAADRLAAKFIESFEEQYGNAHLDSAIRGECPGTTAEQSS